MLIIVVAIPLLAFAPGEARVKASAAVRTVVIDPGHGGRDFGAIGRHSREKDIALAISLKLGEYINAHLPEVEVIFTRNRDVFVPLHERAQIANDSKADLFISVHCNSSTNSRAAGTETFVMGLHRSQANLEVARRENKSILYEDDYLETYDGFDPNSPEANIIFSLYQNAYLEQSLRMAALVQDQFRERARRIDRGVKQAGFLVLYQVTMPGILVEAGFISNAREEQYLLSESGQAHIASAIFRAFRDYKEEQDGLLLASAAYASERAHSNQGRTVQESVGTHKDSASDEEINEVLADQEEQKPDTAGENERELSSDVVFRVQFASTSEKRSHDDPAFAGLEGVSYYFHEELYKYTVGNESTLDAATSLQRKVQEAGFKDAFVVAFLNEERISAQEAIRRISEQSAE